MKRSEKEREGLADYDNHNEDGEKEKEDRS